MSYAGLVMGGLAIGGSLLGSMSANQQASAVAKQQQMIAENANFQRRMAIDQNNRNIIKANLAKARANQQIENFAISTRAINEVYGKLSFDNSKSQYSKQTMQINNALLSTVSSRNISTSSGTARALLRQNLENARTNMVGLKITQANKNRDITTAYQNALASRDFNYVELQRFVPGSTAVADTAISGGMMAGMAGLAGLQAGVSTHLMYSKGTGVNPTSQDAFVAGVDPSTGYDMVGSRSGLMP